MFTESYLFGRRPVKVISPVVLFGDEDCAAAASHPPSRVCRASCIGLHSTLLLSSATALNEWIVDLKPQSAIYRWYEECMLQTEQSLLFGPCASASSRGYSFPPERTKSLKSEGKGRGQCFAIRAAGSHAFRKPPKRIDGLRLAAAGRQS